MTSGQDGCVRLFDLRQSASATNNSTNTQGLSKAAAEMQLPRKEEALSVAIGYGGPWRQSVGRAGWSISTICGPSAVQAMAVMVAMVVLLVVPAVPACWERTRTPTRRR